MNGYSASFQPDPGRWNAGRRSGPPGRGRLVPPARQGRFWEYLLHLDASFDRFRVEDLPAWAEAVGMKRDVFEKDMAGAVLRDALVESRKEGLRNEVEVTPTLFLDGRKFLGDVTLEEIVDAAGEEFDSLRGETRGRP